MSRSVSHSSRLSGHSSMARQAASGMPEGDPVLRGRSVDPGAVGYATHAKPIDDAREDSADDESMYRRDDADDLAKSQSTPDTREEWLLPNGIGWSEPGPWDASPKTKYPYRDEYPRSHNASVTYVVQAYLANSAPVRRYVPGLRVALRLDDILDGLNPKFETRALQCVAMLKRVDRKNLRWIFSVDCGNGAKVVKVKALRKKNVTKLPLMDLDLSCSCPAWRWLGPEHHAKTEDYLDGRPRGTASVPVIRDPKMQNRVCKHVAAVLSELRRFEVPATKKK